MEKISPVYARFVLRDILQLGIPADRLFEGTSLTRRELETGGDIAMLDFLRVLDNGRRLSGNEKLGLMIGRNADIITLGPVGMAAAISPSLREGFQVLENYTRLHITYMRVRLTSTLQGLSIGLEYLQDTGDVSRFHLETGMMLVQDYVETVSGRPLTTAEYRLPIPEPDYAHEYANCLHSPVSFDWRQFSVELPAEVLDSPSPYYNADMWRQATQGLAQQIRDLEGRDKQPYMHYVQTLMRSSNPPLPELSQTAERLHMSERTLNRRLQREGTSFREIRNAVLHTWATQYLRATANSVEAIAAALGYQDAANFRRAFRKNEGCSPGEYRRRHSGVNSATK